MLGALLPGTAAAWPQSMGPASWPIAEGGSFRYHVQPAATGATAPSAEAFRTEFGPVFDTAERLATTILATSKVGPVDVYAYSNLSLFQAMLKSRPIGLTPHAAVVVDTASSDVLVDLTTLLTLSTTQVEDAVRNAVTQVAVQHAAAGAAPASLAAGIGLYVELPTPEYLARLASTVQEAS
jgi:hypothetical protein